MIYFEKTISSKTSYTKTILWGLIAAVVMMILSQTIFKKPVAIPPKIDILKTKVIPLLNKTPNTFSLKQEFTIIPQSQASSSYEQASGYGVVDLETGDVIAQKELSQKLPIASLTKIMTAVVALDLVKPDELIPISMRASRQIPTKIGVVPGEKMTGEELLHAMLLTSANDAAQAIKDGVDEKYHDAIFIAAMNEKATYLGLKNTHFANPQGFDSSDNYSTVEDLALLSHYALTNYPIIKEIVQKDYYLLPPNKYHKQFDLYNWNGLIGVYPNARGMKIGNTDDAGKTTIVVSARGGKEILVVLLGAPGILERDLWASQLLDLGYEQLLNLPPVNVTEEQLRTKYASWKYWN